MKLKIILEQDRREMQEVDHIHTENLILEEGLRLCIGALAC